MCFILIATWSAWAWEILCTEFKRTNLLWKLWNYLRAILKPLQIFIAVIQMLEIKRMEWHLVLSAKTCLDYSFEHNHWKELPLVDYRIFTRHLLSIKMHSYFMEVVPVHSFKSQRIIQGLLFKITHTQKLSTDPTFLFLNLCSLHRTYFHLFYSCFFSYVFLNSMIILLFFWYFCSSCGLFSYYRKWEFWAFLLPTCLHCFFF